MEPPWLKYPHIPAASIGWRMDGGEDYLARFDEWFGSLSVAEQEAYVQANRPPQAWRTYGIFRHPPWPKPNASQRLLAVKLGTLLLVILGTAIIVAAAILAFG